MARQTINPDTLLLAIIEALEDAGIGPVPLAQSRKLVDGLLERFPQMVDPTGIRKPWTRWTETEEEELIRRYQTGEPIRSIAEALGKTRGQITGRITRLKLVRQEGEDI